MKPADQIRHAVEGALLVDGRIPETPTPERVAQAGGVETVIARYAIDDGSGGIVEAETAALRLPDDSRIGRLFRAGLITADQYRAGCHLVAWHYAGGQAPFKRTKMAGGGRSSSAGYQVLSDTERAVEARQRFHRAMALVHPSDRDTVRLVVIEGQTVTAIGGARHKGVHQSKQQQWVLQELRRGLDTVHKFIQTLATAA